MTHASARSQSLIEEHEAELLPWKERLAGGGAGKTPMIVERLHRCIRLLNTELALQKDCFENGIECPFINPLEESDYENTPPPTLSEHTGTACRKRNRSGVVKKQKTKPKFNESGCASGSCKTPTLQWSFQWQHVDEHVSPACKAGKCSCKKMCNCCRSKVYRQLHAM